ncbi:MAG: polyprenyl synthetase family protein [Candidatus Bathyarchaeia archaeon]
MSSIDNILNVGRRVDPIIRRHLFEGADPSFRPVLQHQIASGGKRVRAAMAIISCQASGGRVLDALYPAAAIELTHNYSLILDDIIDRGDIRRGLPTVRAEYSEAIALLAAMFYREALDRIIEKSRSPTEVRRTVRSAIKELIEGERLDILFEQAGRPGPYIEKLRFRSATIEDYLNMIRRKTAALIKAACEVGAIAAGSPPRITKALKLYGEKVGLAFQVIDDYLDIFGEETGKVRGKDLMEHKLGNAVILYALEELTDLRRDELLNLLKKEKLSGEDLDKGMGLISQTGAKERAYKLGQRLIHEGIAALRPLKETRAKKGLIALAEFIGERLY